MKKNEATGLKLSKASATNKRVEMKQMFAFSDGKHRELTFCKMNSMNGIIVLTNKGLCIVIQWPNVYDAWPEYNIHSIISSFLSGHHSFVCSAQIRIHTFELNNEDCANQKWQCMWRRARVALSFQPNQNTLEMLEQFCLLYGAANNASAERSARSFITIVNIISSISHYIFDEYEILQLFAWKMLPLLEHAHAHSLRLSAIALAV